MMMLPDIFQLPKRSGRSPESGIGLVTVMAISGMVLGLITLYTKKTELVRKIGENQEFKTGRDEIAKSILTHIANPEFMKNILTPEGQELSEGNRMFKKCLELDDGDTNTSVDNTDCTGIAMTEEEAQKTPAGYYMNRGREQLYRLTLTPPRGTGTGDDRWVYQYPGNRAVTEDKFGQKINCPARGADHISCLLAGSVDNNRIFSATRDTKSVGFNFRGESSELSPCYPLEAVVYMNPVCGKDPVTGSQSYTCTFAEEFGFAIQIIHRDADFFRGEVCADKTRVPYHNMGSYPKQLSFIFQPRHLLAGYECNEGAYAEGYFEDGNINCQCRFPYRSTGRQNERGVLCEQFTEECPDGTTFVGRKSDGSPVCEYMNEMSEVEISEEVTLGTSGGESFPGQSIECSDNGWMKRLSMECVGSVTTEKNPVEGDICSEGWFLMNVIKGTVHFFQDGKFLYIDDEPWGKGCTNVKTRVYFTAYIDKIVAAAKGSIVHTICLLVRLGICLALAAAALFGYPIVLALCLGVLIIPWVDYSFDCYPIEDEPDITCTLQGHCYKFGDKVRSRLKE